MKLVHGAMFAMLMGCVGVAHATRAADQTVTSDRIVATARSAFPAVKGSMKVTLRVIGVPHDATVPDGSVRLEVQPVVGRWPRARVAVSVLISVDGKALRTETIWFAVKATQTAWVYGSDAPAGTPVGKLKIRQADVDVAESDGQPVKTLASLADERLKRGVHAGWPLLAGDFEPVPDVDTRSQVVVHVHYGPIRIETLAQAMGAGEVGDTVPVLIKGAASPVLARIVGKGAVDIAR
jgi:flagella basal body P-ring formation protein FlgA